MPPYGNFQTFFLFLLKASLINKYSSYLFKNFNSHSPIQSYFEYYYVVFGNTQTIVCRENYFTFEMKGKYWSKLNGYLSDAENRRLVRCVCVFRLNHHPPTIQPIRAKSCCKFPLPWHTHHQPSLAAALAARVSLGSLADTLGSLTMTCSSLATSSTTSTSSVKATLLETFLVSIQSNFSRFFQTLTKLCKDHINTNFRTINSNRLVLFISLQFICQIGFVKTCITALS